MSSETQIKGSSSVSRWFHQVPPSHGDKYSIITTSGKGIRWFGVLINIHKFQIHTLKLWSGGRVGGVVLRGVGSLCAFLFKDLDFGVCLLSVHSLNVHLSQTEDGRWTLRESSSSASVQTAAVWCWMGFHFLHSVYSTTTRQRYAVQHSEKLSGFCRFVRIRGITPMALCSSLEHKWTIYISIYL